MRPLLVLLTTMTTVAALAQEPPAASLATAEFAFAARSVATDMKQAFLSVMTDDAILFRPGPVNGREVMAKSPAPPIELNWRPAFVHVAASGDFGVSTGPARILFKADPKRPPRYTHFLSIWEKLDGAWKLRVDVGIDHAEPFNADAWLELSQSAAKGPGRDALLAAERAFNATTVAQGYAAALAAHADANIRVYRTPLKPMLGVSELSGKAFHPAGTQGDMVAHGIAASGDLGWAVTKLSASDKPAAPIAHSLRVWRAQGEKFLLLADLAVDMPKAQ
ncbi:MAG: nuclear transport factor 2 family protein [Burkholderiales bacterium]|nr:nuclear transport factor 2 family protein [Burkholderiales bacterium]